MQGPMGHVKEFRLCSKCTIKSLEGFRKASDKSGCIKKKIIVISMNPLSIIYLAGTLIWCLIMDMKDISKMVSGTEM